MKLKIVIALCCLILFKTKPQAQNFTTEQYRQDFAYFWQNIHDEYCYFSKKQTDWDKVKLLYYSMIDTVSSRSSFLGIIERALYELYDHHCNLNTNTDYSRRLVPTSTDMWAEYKNNKPVITEVRMKSGAAACGIIAGMEIVAINDIPAAAAVTEFLPKSLRKPDTESKAFALRLLLAGNHIQPRKFSLKINGVIKDYFPDKDGMQLEHHQYNGKIATQLYNNIGYIRINNCLYDNELIHVFDSAMTAMKNTKAMILDLRETPSGGNTSVARAILGWFINKEHFYQQHEYYAEEKQTGIKRSWQEIVSPRAGKYYSKPLVILVNHWTGSVAEGIAIGFDCLRRPGTKIIGTTMARLNGAVYSYEMPHTKIGFTYTAERLYHINGKPREEYIPNINLPLAALAAKKAGDIFITAALNYLKGK